MNNELEALVDQYLKGDHPYLKLGPCITPTCGDCSIEFEEMETLEDAIRISSLSDMKSGKRHPHQCCILKGALPKLERELQKRKGKLANVRDFDQLHTLISDVCREITGVAELVIYDVSLRIAQGFLGLEPEFVYLHSGAAKGARHLGVRKKKALISDFPAPLHRLNPAQMEDFLCIFKDQIGMAARER